MKVHKFAGGARPYTFSAALLSFLLSQPAQQPFWVSTSASIQTWWTPWIKRWFFTSWGIKTQQVFTLRTLRSMFNLWNFLFLQIKLLLCVNGSCYCHDISFMLRNRAGNYWKSGVLCLLRLPYLGGKEQVMIILKGTENSEERAEISTVEACLF